MYMDAKDIHAHFSGKLSVWTIRQYMASGKIESFKLGSRWVTTRREIEAFEARCEHTQESSVVDACLAQAGKHSSATIDFWKSSPKQILQHFP
jgi:hypothetical protein